MPPAVPTSPLHRAAGLIPVLELLADEGLPVAECLRGTGINAAELEREDSRVRLSQEQRLFANLLRLSGDPTIGLRLARRYPPKRYGLFGYAMLSAPTLGQALAIAARFGEDLTFTWLHLGLHSLGDEVQVAFSDRYPIAAPVRDFLYDRDTMAAKVAIDDLLGEAIPLSRVALPHDGHGQRTRYRQMFGCAVEFGHSEGATLAFPAAWLERSLPFRDAASSVRLQAECQRLLQRFEPGSDLSSEVREILLGQPGYFPGIEVVAKRLALPERTLRHRLAAEGASYQSILDQVRHRLACEYLDNTALPVQDIAQLLGFGEPGNFTHAFKKWAGMAPLAYRRRARQATTELETGP